MAFTCFDHPGIRRLTPEHLARTDSLYASRAQPPSRPVFTLTVASAIHHTAQHIATKRHQLLYAIVVTPVVCLFCIENVYPTRRNAWDECLRVSVPRKLRRAGSWPFPRLSTNRAAWNATLCRDDAHQLIESIQPFSLLHWVHRSTTNPSS